MLVKRIIYDNNKTIQNNEGILCEIRNDKGETEMKFISTTYLESIGLMFDAFDDSASTSSSGTKNTETCNIQCDKENENSFIIINQTHKWNEKETKYLLDQYCLYFPQIGPFRAFKNRAAVFEQISKDLYEQFDIRVTGLQCSNRYKNVSRQHKNALSGNKVSGHAPTEVPYGSEFEEIKNIDDSLKPEVLVGVNQTKINKRKLEFSNKNIETYDISNDSDEKFESDKPKKKVKSNQSLENILREIANTAEENRDRRHQEKCDLLRSLLGNSAKDSNSI